MKERLRDFWGGEWGGKSASASLAAEILWSREESETSSRHFLFKFVPFARPSPTTVPSALSISGKAVKAKRGKGRIRSMGGGRGGVTKACPLLFSGDWSFLCAALGPALTHWLFYLMWNSTRSAELRQLNHNRIIRHPSALFLSLCLSFACRRKQPELHWFSFFKMFVLYWITWWGSKHGLIQVMAFYPYAN